MEGKKSKTPGSISTKSTGSSRLTRPEKRRSGAVPTNTMPEISGGSRPSTITLPQETIERMIRLLKADSDPSLILALMGAVPTPNSETGGSSLSTVTLARDVLERMIRVLNPEADPSLVLALIGADLAPPPTGTTDIPEQGNEDVSSTGEVRRNEPGEEVEQQLDVIRKDEEVVQPQEQEIVRAEVSIATKGGEGADTLGLEQPLPTTRGIEEAPIENVGRVDTDHTALHVKEVGHKLPIDETSTEETMSQRDVVIEIAREITMEVEPSPLTGAQGETYSESTPAEATVTTEPAGEAEQPLLTPAEVMENLAVRNAEDAEADTVVKGSEIFELCPT